MKYINISKLRSAIQVLFVLNLSFLNNESFSQTLNHIFKSGEDGYQCFRIPAIISSNKKSILAFAEGRKNNCGDAGNIDLVMKKSDDGGKTWSALTVIWDDGENTCGNPAPVLDSKTGTIWLLSTWNLGTDHEPQIINGSSKDTRRIYVLSSTDNGSSWSVAKEITSTVKKPEWTWYATGPGNGIQMRSKKYKDRLIIPCDHIESISKKYYSHTIYSDDHGKTWLLGGSTNEDMVNECTVAELPDGKLLLNMRNYNSLRIRQTATSEDGGINWSSLKGDTTLIEPVCQASLISFTVKRKKPVLAFSNPASTTNRTNMIVRLSYDNGATWPRQYLVYKGPAAYSNLVVLPNGNLGCFFEAGIKSAYEGIVFEEIPLLEFK